MAAPKAPTFDQWINTVRTNGSKTISDVAKLSSSQQHSLYKTFVAQWAKDAPSSDGSQGGAAFGMTAAPGLGQSPTELTIKTTRNALETNNEVATALSNFQKNPGSAPRPNAPGTPTAQGQQAINDATAAAQANPSSQTAKDTLSALLGTGGAGAWYPWMTKASTVGAGGVGIDLSGGSKTPTLTDDQQTAFREQWNQEHPDSQFSDNKTFMASSDVMSGAGNAVSSFEHAFNTGSGAVRYYNDPNTVLPGNPFSYLTSKSGINDPTQGSTTTSNANPTAIGIPESYVNKAKDPNNGGVPALDQYMNSIVSDAQDQGVPWQLLWGVLRARLQTNPNMQTGIGPFGLPDSASGAQDAAAQIKFLAEQLKTGYGLTQDWAFAALYTDNPQSALQLFHSGKSAPGRTAADGQYVQSVMGNATGSGELDINLIGYGNTGGAGQHTRSDLITNQVGGVGSGAGAAAGPAINLPDMNALTQSAAQLITQYLFRAPNPGEAEAMAAQMRDASIQAQKQGAPAVLTPEQIISGYVDPTTGNQKTLPNDPASGGGTAGFTADIKNSPDFQALYAKRGQLSEADYAKQFTDLQSNMGTGVTDNAAIRSGMQQGDPNVTGGQILAGEGNNSNFRQRLYQIAASMAGT